MCTLLVYYNNINKYGPCELVQKEIKSTQAVKKGVAFISLGEKVVKSAKQWLQ